MSGDDKKLKILAPAVERHDREGCDERFANLSPLIMGDILQNGTDTAEQTAAAFSRLQTFYVRMMERLTAEGYSVRMALYTDIADRLMRLKAAAAAQVGQDEADIAYYLLPDEEKKKRKLQLLGVDK